MPYEMVVYAYSGRDEAQASFEALRSAQATGLHLVEAALVERDDDGKLHAHDSLDSDAGRGSVVGAVLGGLVGLIGGPVTVVLGAAAGGGLGRAAAKKADLGLLADDAKEFTEGLRPETYAVVAVAGTDETATVDDILSAQGTRILRQMLTEHVEEAGKAAATDADQ